MAAAVAWQPDYTAEFNRRTRQILRLRKDSDMRHKVMAFYANNPVQWINDYAITYNPRNSGDMPKLMPFVLFDKQVEFIEFLMACLADKESGLVEKARDMGATWLCCAFSVWLFLFMPYSAVGWGSRKESLVDKIGDPDSIFQKMRMILAKLPDWMLPAGFSIEQHATYMKIVNPVNGATITGETGDNIGRGGRKLIYFKDESAHYERPELIEAALGDNTDVQIDISSVKGTASVFYRRRQAGEIWFKGKNIEKGKTRVFILDWRDNPFKTQEWYNARRKRAEAEGLLHVFAQEVDRDYTASLAGIIIPAKWAKACIDAHKVLKMRDDGEHVAAQDVADGGNDKNAYARRKGIILREVDHWGGEAGKAARRSIPLAAAAGVREMYYDAVGVGAGFKTEANNLEEKGAIPDTLLILPWFGSGKVLEPDDNIIPGDDKTPTNDDFFGNLKAQAWWSLRTRIYKTYQAVVFGEVYDHEELCSFDSQMPLVHELITQLSQATHDTGGKGKMIVDKTPDGSNSPNLADAVVMCYFPTRELSTFDVL